MTGARQPASGLVFPEVLYALILVAFIPAIPVVIGSVPLDIVARAAMKMLFLEKVASENQPMNVERKGWGSKAQDATTQARLEAVQVQAPSWRNG